MSAALKQAERIVDASGAAEAITALLPVGVRRRQLTARTLLIGMILTILAGSDAFLTNIHRTLLALAAGDRRRLKVTAQWHSQEHQLTYRQLEYTYRLVCKALSKPAPDGTPSPQLSDVLDRLLEASVKVLGQPASSSYAVDWTDLETWARPPRKPRAELNDDHDATKDDHRPDGDDGQADADPQTRCADPEAAWGTATPTTPQRASCSSATTCKRSRPSATSTAPRSPSWSAGSSSTAATTTRPPRSSPS